MSTSEQPIHELVDFVKLAAVETNEQKILAALLRIEALLMPPKAPMVSSAAETIKAKPGATTLLRRK